MKKGFLPLFLLSLPLQALEVQPWFSDPLEFHLHGGFAYSHFNRVNHGEPPLDNTFYSRLYFADLELAPSANWSVDIDLQLADTTKEPFGFREAGAQVRYLFLDDIVGDPVSLAGGVSLRGISTDALRDISSPYHGNLDVEINVAVGKEFDQLDDWRFRLWAFGALGHANRGSPWIRAITAFEMNIHSIHKFALFAEGIAGYGGHRVVHIDDFHGYAKIRERAIDVGVRYGRRISVYGTLRFEYVRRVLAKSCPAGTNNYILSYVLPFSF